MPAMTDVLANGTFRPDECRRWHPSRMIVNAVAYAIMYFATYLDWFAKIGRR